MKDVFVKFASVLSVFVCGCVVGAVLLYFNLRLNAIEQNQVAFQKGVEDFAKQVNSEFSKLKPQTPPLGGSAK